MDILHSGSSSIRQNRYQHVKTRKFTVINNRLHFKCPSCSTKRYYSIQNTRRKNVRCFRCGDTIKCVLNRRSMQRVVQTGKLILATKLGEVMDVNLRNISRDGVGFEIPTGRSARFLSVGEQIFLKCNWNPQLLSNNRFIVQNIRGQQIGVKKA